ncbi:hypothetical protein HOD08_01940 [bacterium]|nr:hypothetical protein [bacterium]
MLIKILSLIWFSISFCAFDVNAGRNRENNKPLRVVIPSNAKVKLSSLSGIVRRFRLGKTEKIRKEAKADLVCSFGVDVKVFVDWILSFPQYNWSSMENDLKAVKGSKVEDLNGREKLKQLVEACIEFEETASPLNSGNRSTSRTFVPSDPSALSPDAFRSERYRKEKVVAKDAKYFIECLANFFAEATPRSSQAGGGAVTYMVIAELVDRIDELASMLVSGKTSVIRFDGRAESFELAFKASGDYTKENSINVKFEDEFDDVWDPERPLYRGPRDVQSFFTISNFVLFSERLVGVRKQKIESGQPLTDDCLREAYEQAVSSFTLKI